MSDHPDDTGPFLCECCDATHAGPREPAESSGWILTWDGFLCPKCVAAFGPEASEDE